MTLYLLKVHLQTSLSIPIIQKCQILSCDTLVANVRYVCVCVLARARAFVWGTKSTLKTQVPAIRWYVFARPRDVTSQCQYFSKTSSEEVGWEMCGSGRCWLWFMSSDEAVMLFVSFLVNVIPFDMIYLLTAIGLTPGGSNTIHIYTQTIHRTTQFTNYEERGPCPVFARYTLAFALQLRKKHGKTSVRVAGECQLARWNVFCVRTWTHSSLVVSL